MANMHRSHPPRQLEFLHPECPCEPTGYPHRLRSLRNVSREGENGECVKPLSPPLKTKAAYSIQHSPDMFRSNPPVV